MTRSAMASGLPESPSTYGMEGRVSGAKADLRTEEAQPPAGEAEAQLDRLYRLHGAWLRRAISRRFGRWAADDLAQETFMRVRTYARETAILHPKALLLTIARNAWRDQQRAASHRPCSLQSGDQAGPEGPMIRLTEQEAALALKDTILHLPPKLRDVFLLSRLGGLTYEEIAMRCGISRKAVEWRMSKALAICAARMQDD